MFNRRGSALNILHAVSYLTPSLAIFSILGIRKKTFKKIGKLSQVPLLDLKSRSSDSTLGLTTGLLTSLVQPYNVTEETED